MMRKFNGNIIFILLLMGCIFSGFSKHSDALTLGQQVVKREGAITAISPKQAQELMQQREDLLVVDVRTAQERKRAAIADSIHVPMQDIFQNKTSLSNDQPVLLYCAVGGRSSAAAYWLQKNGFTEIYNLVGGISEWQKQGLPVVVGD